jgi:hypothetical protein
LATCSELSSPSSNAHQNSGWWQIGPSPNYSQVSHVTVPGAYRYRAGFVAWSGSFVTWSGSHGGLL